jgi:hypothetical protein
VALSRLAVSRTTCESSRSSRRSVVIADDVVMDSALRFLDDGRDYFRYK